MCSCFEYYLSHMMKTSSQLFYVFRMSILILLVRTVSHFYAEFYSNLLQLNNLKNFTKQIKYFEGYICNETLVIANRNDVTVLHKIRFIRHELPFCINAKYRRVFRENIINDGLLKLD